jgi:hypothetical protein
MVSPGSALFEIGGKTMRLDPLVEAGEMHEGSETGGGR